MSTVHMYAYISVDVFNASDMSGALYSICRVCSVPEALWVAFMYVCLKLYMGFVLNLKLYGLFLCMSEAALYGVCSVPEALWVASIYV